MNPRRRHPRTGSALIDVPLAIAVLAVILAFILAPLYESWRNEQMLRARAEVSNLGTLVRMFQQDNGALPTCLSDLTIRPAWATAWPAGGYLPKVGPDPWGNDYLYVVPGPRGRAFDVISLGADGRAGGEGWSRDIAYSERYR